MAKRFGAKKFEKKVPEHIYRNNGNCGYKVHIKHFSTIDTDIKLEESIIKFTYAKSPKLAGLSVGMSIDADSFRGTKFIGPKWIKDGVQHWREYVVSEVPAHNVAPIKSYLKREKTI